MNPGLAQDEPTTNLDEPRNRSFGCVFFGLVPFLGFQWWWSAQCSLFKAQCSLHIEHLTLNILAYVIRYHISTQMFAKSSADYSRNPAGCHFWQYKQKYTRDSNYRANRAESVQSGDCEFGSGGELKCWSGEGAFMPLSGFSRC
jgi:hypothetical protein